MRSQIVLMNCNVVEHPRKNFTTNQKRYKINRDYRVSDGNHLDLCQSDKLCTIRILEATLDKGAAIYTVGVLP